MNRFPVLIGAILVAGIGFGWYFGSPYWTLKQIHSAAEARDGDRLAAYVDFPALRDSLKAELAAAAMAQASQDEEGFGVAGAAIGTAFAGAMVDQMVTESGLREMMRQEDRRGPAAIEDFDMESIEIERVGLSEFRLTSKDPEMKGGAVVFLREGLAWKVAGVRLPDEARARMAR